MRKVKVKTDSASYNILIKRGLLKSLASLMQGKVEPGKTVVVTDKTVEDLYGDQLETSLRSAGLDYFMLSVEPGEESKTLGVAERLYNKLAELNLHRDSTVLAFGGGVVGDLAGYVGSTYLRGLSVIQIPTTLLSQVDSSVGGKTAVNLPEGKNLVGTFHQPELVLIDPTVLSTLSASEVRSGLGEVLKYGLIRDRNLFEKALDCRTDSIENFESLGWLISRCCEIKAKVVREDEKDRGVRRILNFGHTLGHGLEAGSGYGRLKHGEAVIWGMVAELWLSCRRGYLGEETLQDLTEPLLNLSVPPLPEDLTGDDLLEYVLRDKKVKGETINCVMLKIPGEETSVEKLDHGDVLQAWKYLQNISEERR